MSIRIGLIGDYDQQVTAHRAVPMALDLAAARTGNPLEFTWIGTAALGKTIVSSTLAPFNALWCVPASPYADTDAAIAAIRFARETGRPFLGTCGGFQHALLEYARHVLGYAQAEHAETCPDASMRFIAPLACSLVEKSGVIVLGNDSKLREIYGRAEAEEEYHCNYGLNPEYERLLGGSDLHVSGRDGLGAVRAVELRTHPFFIATLFQPERAALRGIAHPLVNAYVTAAHAESRRFLT